MYAVVLNDDLHQPQTITVRVGEKTASLSDLVRGGEIPLKLDFVGGSAAAAIRLAPGDGTILAIGQQ